MKKMILLLMVGLGFPWMLKAQNVYDDLYYTPTKAEKEQVRQIKEHPSTVEQAKLRHSRSTADIDRYDNDLDGEWIGGFDGSNDDYEYATRLIRFRNPRFAVSVSSPFYWDVVYGLNSWDWNIYTDGFYAYAFPRYSNRLWWDWRFSPYGSYPYYGFSYGYGWSPWYYGPSWNYGWYGWYDPYYYYGYNPYYDPYYAPYYYGGYYPVQSRGYYNDRRNQYVYSNGRSSRSSGYRYADIDEERRYGSNRPGRVSYGSYGVGRSQSTRSYGTSSSSTRSNRSYESSGSYQRMTGNSSSNSYSTPSTRSYTPSYSSGSTSRSYSSGSNSSMSRGGARRR